MVSDNKIDRPNDCVICGDVIENIENSHNPFPIRNPLNEDGYCCERCNSNYVIPLRILGKNDTFWTYKIDD